jgi:hypothetical protein
VVLKPKTSVACFLLPGNNPCKKQHGDFEVLNCFLVRNLQNNEKWPQFKETNTKIRTFSSPFMAENYIKEELRLYADNYVLLRLIIALVINRLVVSI